MRGYRLPLEGKRFGKLTGIKPVSMTPAGAYVWRFKCDCGNEIDAIGSKVKNYQITSCGCEPEKF